jgi:hypothetical protein
LSSSRFPLALLKLPQGFFSLLLLLLKLHHCIAKNILPKSPFPASDPTQHHANQPKGSAQMDPTGLHTTRTDHNPPPASHKPTKNQAIAQIKHRVDK